jgi:8-oxo-dGTP pyrophosphatase MutT (NUDIX family)
MRTFPNAWVFPGGQIDHNESIFDALIREISEETGVVIEYNSETKNHCINNSKVDFRPLLLYESVFPNRPSISHVNQSLIMFYSIKTEESFTELKLNIQTTEVDAYAWVNMDLLRQILFEDEGDLIYKIDASLYDYETSFYAAELNEKSFINKSIGQIIPYGHYLALKSLLNSLE